MGLQWRNLNFLILTCSVLCLTLTLLNSQPFSSRGIFSYFSFDKTYPMSYSELSFHNKRNLKTRGSYSSSRSSYSSRRTSYSYSYSYGYSSYSYLGGYSSYYGGHVYYSYASSANYKTTECTLVTNNTATVD